MKVTKHVHFSHISLAYCTFQTNH